MVYAPKGKAFHPILNAQAVEGTSHPLPEGSASRRGGSEWLATGYVRILPAQFGDDPFFAPISHLNYRCKSLI